MRAKKAYSKYRYSSVVIACVAALLLLSLVGMIRPEAVPNGDIADMRGGWTTDAGENVQFPRRLGSGSIIISRAIPQEVPDNAVVYVDTNYQRVRAYLDGVEIGMRRIDDSAGFALNADCPWTVVLLPDDARGKTLTLELSGTGSKPSVEVYNVMAGRESEIRLILLEDAMPMLLICACATLLVLILFAYAITMKIHGVSLNFWRIIYISAFGLLTAGWIFTDTDIQAVYFIGSRTYFIINTYFYLLMPLPFLMLVRDTSGKMRRSVNISIGLVLAEVFLNSLALVTGHLRLYITLALSHVALALAITLAIAQCLIDRVNRLSDSSNGTFISLCALGATGLCAMARYYLVVDPDNTLFFRYGVVFFVVVFGVDAVRGATALIAKSQNYEQLRISEEEYRIAALHSNKMILRYDIDTQTAYQQPKATAEFQLPTVIENMPESVIESGIIDPESVDTYRNIFNEMRSGKASGSATYRMRRATGDYRWYRADFTTILSKSGEPIQAIMSFYDITDLREKEIAFEKWQQNYDAMPRNAINYYECNLTKDTFEREEGGLLGAIDADTPRKLSAMAIHIARRHIYHEDRTKFLEFCSRNRLLARYYSGMHSGRMALRRIGENDEPMWTMASVQMIPDPYSTDVRVFLLLQDIDEEKKAELLMSARQNEDSLTRLYNRGAFINAVTQLFGMGQLKARHALLMIDIDGFKQINDIFGHHTGDQTLRRIADKLRESCENDLLGRVGGDEFIVCLKDIPIDAESLEDRVGSLLSKLNGIGEGDVKITVSIGVAIYPDDGNAFEELYKKSDKALYDAKRHGKNRYMFYSGD